MDTVDLGFRIEWIADQSAIADLTLIRNPLDPRSEIDSSPSGGKDPRQLIPPDPFVPLR
jgi:hypothetical protein